jgi:hypothetical protein
LLSAVLVVVSVAVSQVEDSCFWAKFGIPSYNAMIGAKFHQKVAYRVTAERINALMLGAESRKKDIS